MTRRLRRTGGAVLLLCGVCSPTFGAEPEEPRPWRQRLLQGFLEFRGTAFAHPGPTDPVRRRTELRLRWEPEVSLGPRAWLQVELEARTGNAHFHRGTIDRRDAERPHRFLLDLRQATLDLYWPGLDLRIGKQVISWGTADGFSPTDNLNPRDYLDLLWEEKIGVPALKATATLGPVTWETVLVPSFTPARLPAPRSRWRLLPVPFPLTLLPRERVADHRRHGQVGVRLATTTKGWDWSLSFYDGMDDLPIGRLGPGTFQYVFPRKRVLGADWATVLPGGDLELHGEVAWTRTDGGRDDDLLQYVLGVTRTFRGHSGAHPVMLTAEYAGEHRLRERRAPARTLVNPLGRFFPNSILVRVHWEWSRSFAAEWTGAWNLDGADNWLLSAEARVSFTDHLQWTLGLDLLEGRPHTIIGRYDRNDRLFTTLRCHF